MDDSNIEMWFEVPRFSAISIAIIPYVQSHLNAGNDASYFTPITQLDFDINGEKEVRERIVKLSDVGEVVGILKMFVRSLKGEVGVQKLKDNYYMVIRLGEYRVEVPVTENGVESITVYENDELVLPHHYEECKDLEEIEPIVIKVIDYLNTNSHGYLTYRKEGFVTLEFFDSERVADLEGLSVEDQLEIDLEIALRDVRDWIYETGNGARVENIQDESKLCSLFEAYVMGRLMDSMGSKLLIKDDTVDYFARSIIQLIVYRMGNLLPSSQSEEDKLAFNFFYYIDEFGGDDSEVENAPWSDDEAPMDILEEWIGRDLAKIFKKHILYVKTLADTFWNQRNSRGGSSGFDASEA